MKDTQLKAQIIRLLPRLFIIMGAAILVFGVRELFRALESTNWPSTTGTVLASDLASNTDTESGTTYKPHIVYEYRVQNVAYSSSRISFGDFSFSDPSHAQAVLNSYPVSKQVTVYYAPSAPSIRVIEPGIHSQAWFVPGFGMLFSVSGLLFAILQNKQLKRV